MSSIEEVLRRAYVDPFTTKSDFARANASHVAAAACDGLISTKITANAYGHKWQITPLGLSYFWTLKGINHE